MSQMHRASSIPSPLWRMFCVGNLATFTPFRELLTRKACAMTPSAAPTQVRCPDCWNGKPIPCAVGCRDSDECCDKSLAFPCERCNGSGWLAVRS